MCVDKIHGIMLPRRKLDYASMACLLLPLFIIVSLPAVSGIVSCSPSPCKNGGVCVSPLRGESHCECTSKFVGEYCQHLNPCHTGPRCQNGGSCRVKESIGGGTPSFACSCPVGFTASLCEIPLENACDSSPCLNGATCNLKSLHEYVCTCATGYTGKTIFSSLVISFS
ncbi:notch homolog 2 N-terminal-like protein A [Apis florea]|uniref:notch homolog 2 N-terminal-like protein A n=1 Tax=Apis florea TaxID=7463 RepID=UPI0012FF0BED|nr:notch homolog 2 N-terminal-like protein A [Apis florea]